MHFNPSEMLYFGVDFRAIYLLADANYFRNVFGSPDFLRSDRLESKKYGAW
jgi:hypothetical protein